MSRVAFTAPAPEGMGISAIGVPSGSDVDLDVRLESVIEGVLVSGTARVRLVGECSRCLDPISDVLEVDLQELYLYDETDHRGRVVEREDDEDDEARHVIDEHIDLEPVLRDAVVLDLPLAPVCRDDCPGLCPQCGFRLVDDPEHGHDVADPRWDALRDLLETTERSTRHDEKEEG
jgi:uncharacterized protein